MTAISNLSQSIEEMKDKLVATVHYFHNRGWAPATATNYSFRVPGEDYYWFSSPEIDKAIFSGEHLVLIDKTGNTIEAPATHLAPETHLHTLIYENKDVGAVLHTHSVNGTILSIAHEEDGEIILTDFELLKGFSGIKTHETIITIPVFPNVQNKAKLSAEIRSYIKGNKDVYGFLIAGHGLYSWGETIADAKRHIEIFEFIFECLIKLKLYGGPKSSRF